MVVTFYPIHKSPAQRQRKVSSINKYVCITTNKSDIKSNPNPNPNPSTKQHAIVS